MSSASAKLDDAAADWVSTEDAARILSITIATLSHSDEIKAAVARKLVNGTNYRLGWLWSRGDLERIVDLRRRYQLRTTPAARLLSAWLSR